MTTIMREKCKRCGHAYSFHGRGAKTKCRAVGCKKGPKGMSCPGFVLPVDASKELKADMRASRKALSV